MENKNEEKSCSPKRLKKSVIRNFTRDEKGLPCMEPVPGTKFGFCEFPKKPHKDGATPSEISHGNIDSSYTIDFIFKQLDRYVGHLSIFRYLLLHNILIMFKQLFKKFIKIFFIVVQKHLLIYAFLA